MIERTHSKLPVGARCCPLSISRSSFHDARWGGTAISLDLMLSINRQFLEMPFCGVRPRRWHLQNEGHAVNPERIGRLTCPSRLMPIYQKPDTSGPVRGHKTYPSLLGGLWRMRRHHQHPEASRLPLSGGCHGLVHPHGSGLADIEHAEAEFCVEAPNKAIHTFGPPEIMNTAQGSQFTSFAWIGRLKRVRTRISMDGKGPVSRQPSGSPRIDGVHAFDHQAPLAVPEGWLRLSARLRDGVAGQGWHRRWITFYNRHRQYTAHRGQPPAVVRFNPKRPAGAGRSLTHPKICPKIREDRKSVV